MGSNRSRAFEWSLAVVVGALLLSCISTWISYLSYEHAKAPAEPLLRFRYITIMPNQDNTDPVAILQRVTGEESFPVVKNDIYRQIHAAIEKAMESEREISLCISHP